MRTNNQKGLTKSFEVIYSWKSEIVVKGKPICSTFSNEYWISFESNHDGWTVWEIKQMYWLINKPHHF